MNDNKSMEVFTAIDLYNLCLREVGAITIEKETNHPYSFLDSMEGGVGNKYDKLSESQQDIFAEKLRKVAEKYKSNYDNLKDLNNDINSELFEERQNELTYKVAHALEEFWLDE